MALGNRHCLLGKLNNGDGGWGGRGEKGQVSGLGPRGSPSDRVRLVQRVIERHVAFEHRHIAVRVHRFEQLHNFRVVDHIGLLVPIGVLLNEIREVLGGARNTMRECGAPFQDYFR